MQLPAALAGFTPAQLVLAVVTGVLGYLLIEFIRALLRPRKPLVIEYKPRQVSARPLCLDMLWSAHMCRPLGGAWGSQRCCRQSSRLGVFTRAPATAAGPLPQVGGITLDELTKYDGRDPTRALLFAVRGTVYDVTEGRAFYGPGALRRRLVAGFWGGELVGWRQAVPAGQWV